MLSDSLKKIAVTGGLSCGKSTVCQFFKELGAYTVSADEIVHQLLTPTTIVGQQVIAIFGAEIVMDGRQGKQISRSELAKKAFQQPELLRSLENLLHPAVHDEIEKQYRYVASLSFPLFVAEIPLLFESGEERYYDATIAVVAAPALCIERFMQATGYGKEEYFRRMQRQLSPQEKAERASFVIDNDRSLDETKAFVAKIYAEMLPKHPKGV